MTLAIREIDIILSFFRRMQRVGLMSWAPWKKESTQDSSQGNPTTSFPMGTSQEDLCFISWEAVCTPSRCAHCMAAAKDVASAG
eukprot:CAMPEP_0178447156 /NCGR_PEP_ID=MMETSP0689_2-20121128/41224_1 /TAXON_ID=160604 /ORGANISM="Amphidinium massartii, Strain CS-259" /LENGTH=83 /DNA_ID=CAMNT_0020072103 /DNA_START=41 /DNA_END=288 /DNA_ORIENTATION=-